MVRGLFGLDDDEQEWDRRARRKEQSWHVLGHASCGIWQADRQPATARLLPRPFQDGFVAEPVGRGRQLSAGVAAHETLRLFVIQSRSDGGRLPDTFNAAR